MRRSKGKRNPPPSRKKYEENNPTVSSWVSRDLWERLQAVKKAESRSYTDVLKIGLGILEVKVRKEQEIREQAYTEGYDEGFKEARDTYEVTYPCRACGKTIPIVSKNAKEAARQYMMEHGWGHTDCHNQ